VAAGGRVRAVACELEEVDGVQDRQRPRQVGDEDEAAFQRRDEQRLAPSVVIRDLRAELPDPSLDLLCGEVDLADAGIGRYEARSSW
jgi:hypothetical protein